MNKRLTTITPTTNDAMKQWRQGDVILEPNLISEILTTAISSEDTAGRQICGVMIVSQTCDLLKDPSKMPNVEICAVVKCRDKNQLEEARKRRSPRYAFIPGLANSMVVADLCYSTVLRKSRLHTLPRTDGGFDYEERPDNQIAWISRLQDALNRSRGRFAFPDNFNAFKTFFGKELRKAGAQSIAAKIEEIRAEVKIVNDKVIGANLTCILESSPPIDDSELTELIASVDQMLSEANCNLKAQAEANQTPDIVFEVRIRFAEPDDISLAAYRRTQWIDFDDVS